MEKIPLTKPGYDKMNAELKHLKSVERPAIIRAISEAREHGSFARAYERDRARFLRNWPADSRLFKLLDQRLPQVPGTCPERG